MKLIEITGMLFVRHWFKWHKATSVGKDGEYYQVKPTKKLSK
jgi:hypothetical protein